MTQLAIGRLSLEIAAAGVRDPAALRDRIAEAARRDLKRGLALAPGMEGREAVHIRRLEVDLTAIGDIPPERIGIELGRRIGVAIDALVRTPDERTVVFESLAARLAAYLAALIEGAPVDRSSRKRRRRCDILPSRYGADFRMFWALPKCCAFSQRSCHRPTPAPKRRCCSSPDGLTSREMNPPLWRWRF
jgi:hypothetical protein